MANTLVTPSIIAKESLTILENNLVLAAKVTRKFENQFAKIGTTLNVRRPNKYDVSTGPALAVQDTTESTVPITIDQQKHVDFNFTSLERTLVIEELSDRYLRPAMARLANAIDESIASRYSDVPNIVGTPGTTPNNFNSSVKLTGLMLDLEAAPQDNRCLVLGPAAYWEIANGLQSLYVQSVAEPALKGYLVNIGNFEIYLDQNAPTHTVGNYGGTPIVGAAAQTGASLATSGWTAGGTLKKGDVITIAGVFGVNPQNLQSTGVLKNFVVTADTALGATANIPIYPAITPTGRLKNVTASPAASAVITVKSGAANGSYPQNLAFTPEAFGMVSVPLDMPQGVDIGARETYRDISMRVVRAYDINNDAFPTRVDILYGTATFYPEMCVRLTG